ncbi:hypothetical protein RvY_06327 [Ramazzottius varieornatus]|uniref:Uncharacterized protein n=1 Tax=Ramazzottius varieornatus TaxID=947166 RepID=A0A1D1V1P1_RAMVA|nr:hypothetical protein RvY_06327 [Ramazzottius varieornatus]
MLVMWCRKGLPSALLSVHLDSTEKAGFCPEFIVICIYSCAVPQMPPNGRLHGVGCNETGRYTMQSFTNFAKLRATLGLGRRTTPMGPILATKTVLEHLTRSRHLRLARQADIYSADQDSVRNTQDRVRGNLTGMSWSNLL